MYELYAAKGVWCVPVLQCTNQNMTELWTHNDRLNHEIEFPFNMQKIQRWRNISSHVSLRGLRRLTWDESFANAFDPLFTEHDSYHVAKEINYLYITEKYCT